MLKRFARHLEFRIKLGQHYGYLRREVNKLQSWPKIYPSQILELNKTMTFLNISSIGGVASSSLINFSREYSRYLVNPYSYCSIYDSITEFKLKHLKEPLNRNGSNNLVLTKDLESSYLDKRRVKKALFIMGDPSLSILSIYRRNLQFEHFQNVHQIISNNVPKTIDDYVQNNIDVFGYCEMFDNWITAERDYPIMIVKDTEIWNQKHQICDFLEISRKNCEGNFPKQMSRNSSKINTIILFVIVFLMILL